MKKLLAGTAMALLLMPGLAAAEPKSLADFKLADRIAAKVLRVRN